MRFVIAHLWFGLCVLTLLLPAVPTPAAAHPGGLNAQGCHNNRKTGDYHCHRTQRAAPRPSGQSIDGRTYFPNCSAARAAGVTDIRRGQPGYRPALDRDNDGVACESR